MHQPLSAVRSITAEPLAHRDRGAPSDRGAPREQALDPVTERLRQARQRAGFSQRFAAAEKFGWDYPDYVAHERGQISLSMQAAKLYAQGFGVSVEWLLYGIGEIDRREEAPRELTVQELRDEVERLTRENAALLAQVKGGSQD